MFFVIIITVQICKFNITVSTQFLLLYYSLWCPGLQRLQRFDFYLNCARPQVINRDTGYILHPSIEHFHNIPFSLFSLFFKSLGYYKLFCLAQAGTRRRNVDMM